MRLRFETGALAGRSVELPVGVTLVGRAEDCNLVVPDPGVSGRHAELRVAPDGEATVRDLGSRNGTFADGERVTGTWALAAGAELRFGQTTARLVADPAPTRNRAPWVVATLALLLAAAALAIALTQGDDSDDSERAATPTPTESPTPTPTPFTRRDAIERGRTSTMLVGVDGQPSGSGWVLETQDDRALVLTNDHVIAGGSEFTVNLDGGEPRAATLVGASACDDLALLSVRDADGLEALELSEDFDVGDDVLVLGFPDAITDEIRLQVKTGSVAVKDAQLRREDRPADAVYRNLIQIDGAVIPGNSGGPLIAADDGGVLGVNSLSEDFGGRETVGYAIASSRVERVLRYLRDGISVPGMSLAFPEDGSAPAIVGVTSDTLERGGVVDDGSQRLVSVDDREFGPDLEPSMRGLCGLLPELGDDVGTPVSYKIRKPDGNTFEVELEY